MVSLSAQHIGPEFFFDRFKNSKANGIELLTESKVYRYLNSILNTIVYIFILLPLDLTVLLLFFFQKALLIYFTKKITNEIIKGTWPDEGIQQYHRNFIKRRSQIARYVYLKPQNFIQRLAIQIMRWDFDVNSECIKKIEKIAYPDVTSEYSQEELSEYYQNLKSQGAL